MKPLLLFSPLALVASLLVSCNNPADNTTDAEVGEKKDKDVQEAGAGAVKYVFTGNSTIDFEGSKVTGAHKGGFKAFSGHFTLKDGAPAGNDHKVVIDMNSIWSDNDKLTGHLKAPDFFDAEQFPKTTFDVTGIEKKSVTEYTVTGNLAMHGVTRSVSFPATVALDGETAKINAEFDINRFDWGMEFKGKPDDLIRKEVVLRFNLEAKPE